MNLIGGKHLQRGGEGGLGERMRIDAKEERSVDPLPLAILANGLRHRQNVPLIERAIERRSPMARRSKSDALFGNSWIGTVHEKGRNQPGNVHQIGWLRGFARRRVDRHKR